MVMPTGGRRSRLASPKLCVLAEVVSASCRTMSSYKSANKPLTLSLSLGLMFCSVWGNPRGLVA